MEEFRFAEALAELAPCFFIDVVSRRGRGGHLDFGCGVVKVDDDFYGSCLFVSFVFVLVV